MPRRWHQPARRGHRPSPAMRAARCRHPSRASGASLASAVGASCPTGLEALATAPSQIKHNSCRKPCPVELGTRRRNRSLRGCAPASRQRRSMQRRTAQGSAPARPQAACRPPSEASRPAAPRRAGARKGLAWALRPGCQAERVKKSAAVTGATAPSSRIRDADARRQSPRRARRRAAAPRRYGRDRRASAASRRRCGQGSSPGAPPASA